VLPGPRVEFCHAGELAPLIIIGGAIVLAMRPPARNHAEAAAARSGSALVCGGLLA
jgi:hypothetical protein